MVYLTVLLAAYALWTFVCLGVTIPLERPNLTSWHLRFIRFAHWDEKLSPKGNCSYFWLLWSAPILLVLSWVLLELIGRSVVVFIRLIYDWIVYPVSFGEIPSGVLKVSYWKNVVLLETRAVDHKDIPGKRFLGVIILCSALLAWFCLGKTIFSDCSPNGTCTSSYAAIGAAMWLTISLAALGYIIWSLVTKKLGQKIANGWQFISGKICHTLEYTELKDKIE